MDLKELVDALAAMPEADREQAVAEALDATKHLAWVPNPGPQTDAYFSEADELFYGGKAGGGKSDLILGAALTVHTRSLILRQFRDDAKDLGERLLEIVGDRNHWNGQDLIHRKNGRLIRFGGCNTEDDKQRFKGKPQDLFGFDEISDFSESQYTFIIGWNRSAVPGQRCRVIAAGNPPTRPEGLWVVKRWAAWLDPTHHNPAQAGELRWYTNVDGEDTEVDGYGPHLINGEEVFARSRTFIPADLSDNPDLADSGYRASLDSLPEEYRAAYRDGDFGTGLRDDPYQTIPTEWIRAAQARWTSNPPVGVPLCAMGVDVAQGGADDTALALRRDGWYDKIITIPGKLTPDGKAVSGYVVANRRDGAKVIIDLGGGWGGDAFGHLRENGVDTVGYMGVKPSPRRSVCSRYTFFNIRAQAYWQFREALDPSQEQGSTICLPPDAELVADLCAPTYQIVRPNVLKIEAKEDLVKRLGRSPNRGDAVVMAWFDGDKISNQAGGKWQGRKTAPRVVMGRASANTKR